MESIESEVDTVSREAIRTLLIGVRLINQPIFGFPELSRIAAAQYAPLIDACVELWTALSRKLGRPARVLDMNCGLGYVALELARRGASVVGMHDSAEQITVCRALAEHTPGLNVQFVQASIEELMLTGDLREIDLVIGFGVLEQLATTHDHAQVRSWLASLAVRAPVYVFDIAREHMHAFALLESFSFTHRYHEVIDQASGTTRSLIVASKTHWFFSGEFELFTHATKMSHPTNDVQFNGTRSYYRNHDHIAKLFVLSDYQSAANRHEHEQEIRFLDNPPPGFSPLPRKLASGSNDYEAWIVRERLPGELLSEVIRSQEPYDCNKIIKSVLTQLVVLEKAGLFHNDLRTWNVLLLADGSATLIDYGSITYEPKNLIWPKNVFPAFWLFVWCVVTKAPWYGDMYAPAFVSPYNLPVPYQAWALGLWEQSPATWTFAYLLETFDSAMNHLLPATLTADQVWRSEVESYLAQLNRTIFRLYSALTNSNGEPPHDGF